ncbi:MAG: SDR family oxidoreductase [Bacteroidales bacterium]|nr:SDR family oxidoreductase [Bacteroidales bacterium]
MGNCKTVLVAGGAGFIGFHLCKRLLEEGQEVVCLDNLQTGSLDNIQQLSEYPKFRFVNHDILQPYSGLQKIDEIYNLACPASPPHYQRNPINTTKTCVVGMLNLLELAQMHGCPILQASTSEVYGDADVCPQPESYNGNVNPIGLRSCYDEGKRCAEILCMDFYRQYRVNVKIVRIFNTYGPNMAVGDGRVVSNFIVQALGNKPITIYGDGSQTRSFMYVDDLVEGVLKVMGTPAGFTGPVNLGNPDERSIAELASIVIGLCGSRSAVEHQPLPSDDPHRRQPDISLARKVLNWSPCVPLEEGLQRTIDYFRTINN